MGLFRMKENIRQFFRLCHPLGLQRQLWPYPFPGCTVWVAADWWNEQGGLYWTRYKNAYDFEKDISGTEGLALLLLPIGNAAFCHCGRHGWHFEISDGISNGRIMNSFEFVRFIISAIGVE